MTKGIDISKYQPNFDWVKAKNDGCTFAIAKVGEGQSITDSCFDKHYRNAKAHGFHIGAYYMNQAKTRDGAIAEAERCIKLLQNYELDMPVWYDVEYSGTLNLGMDKVSDIIDGFCSTMEKAGYYTGVYMSANPASRLLNKTVREKYDVWVAHYGVSKPSYNGSYGMWQYTDTNNTQDYDYAYKDYPTIIKNMKNKTNDVVKTNDDVKHKIEVYVDGVKNFECEV